MTEQKKPIVEALLVLSGVATVLALIVWAAAEHHSMAKFDEIHKSFFIAQSDFVWSMEGNADLHRVAERRMVCYMNAMAYFNRDHESFLGNFIYWNTDYRKPCIVKF